VFRLPSRQRKHRLIPGAVDRLLRGEPERWSVRQRECGDIRIIESACPRDFDQ
jgi:hypothetical protein